MHRIIKNTVFAIAAALLLPAALVIAESSDKTKAQQEAISLSKDVEQAANKIQSHADSLNAMRASTTISNGSHQHKLHRIATEVNESLRPALMRLVELQPELPEWNRQAIDQMREATATLALSANAAVSNRSNASAQMPAYGDQEYAQLLQNVSSQAGRLVETADATADFADAHIRGTEAGLAISLRD